MGGSRRYATQLDQTQQERIDAHRTETPITLPHQAYGPNPIDWHDRRPDVWAWIQYPTEPAIRRRAVAKGWNDRVVVVSWHEPGGERTVVVWRNAVTRVSSARR